MSQLELYYRKVAWVYPAAVAASYRKPIRVRADDGLDYMLKDDGTSPATPVRAREWICHSLADGAGLPVVEFRPILNPDGRVVFGSKVVLNGGPGGSIYNLLAGTFKAAEAQEVLSATYAIDLFLGNGDRHTDNIMVELDGKGLNRLRLIDFSEASALIEPPPRTTLPPATCNTIRFGRLLRKLYGFSVARAELTLQRLRLIPAPKLQGILDEMPTDWLPATTRSAIATWWSSDARLAHIGTIEKGLADGTLL